MTTTLTELLGRLYVDKNLFPHMDEYISGIISDIETELLAKEKQQIIDAHFDGQLNSRDDENATTAKAETYFNQTFNQ